MVKLLKATSNKPLVSIILPVFNSANFLESALDSLITQTYKNFEIIVINDGSTDRSKKIILSAGDSRIKYVEHTTNQGLVATLNEGFKLAKGKYIARMDPDDISVRSRIKKQVEYLEKNPEVDILGSWIQNFGLYSYIWKVHQTHDYIVTKLLFENSLAHPSVMLRRESIIKSGTLFEEKYHGAEDYMFWSKLAEKGLKFGNIQQSLLKYRTHASQVGESQKDKQQDSSLLVRVYNINKLGLKPTPMEKELHQKLSSWIPLNGTNEVLATGKWLLKILNANKSLGIYDPSALSTIVGEKWAIICYLSSSSNLQRAIYLSAAPQLLPLALKTLYLRYRGKLYEKN
jgi:glycosyltransferase involved in cell wall biosynthesis